jgi:hypothetical protein
MRIRTLLLALGGVFLSAPATAQTAISTLFAGNNNGNIGGCVYFDVAVANPDGVIVRGLEVNLQQVANTLGAVEVYTCPGGRGTNQNNPAAWTLATSGAVTAAGQNLPSTVVISAFHLPAGTTGIALRGIGVSHRYTNGNASNTSWNNGQLTITGGEATNQAFSGTINTPRMANLTLQYDSLFLTNLTGNGSLFNSQIFFDANVLHPRGITVSGLDLHVATASGSNGTATVWTCAGSRIGKQTTSAFWSQVASGPITSAGVGNLSRAAIGSFTLPPGTTGIAVRLSGLSHRYGTTSSSDQNADLQIVGGELTSGQFSGTFSTSRFVNCRVHYFPGASSTSTFGTGCPSLAGSFYEWFANAQSFDLENRAFTMVRDGDAFRVQDGGAFLVPGAGAQILSMSDDSERPTPTLSVPFPYGGVNHSQLMICSNGFVSTGGNNGVGYAPNTPGLLNAPDASWRVWRDLNPAIAAGGRVKFEQRNGIAYITFDGVWNFGGTTTAAANTFQFQFDGNTGNVVIAFGTLSDINTEILVGFSGGGQSLDPGNRDLSTVLATGFTAATHDLPLTLHATLPAMGQAIRFTTGNLDPRTLFGAVMLGLQTFPAGVSLAPQMPGCFQYTNGGVTLPLFLGGATTQTTLYPTPALAGLQFAAQAAVYAPAVLTNAVGAAVSNGVQFTVSNY